jgi:hypothetical protein
MSPSPPKPYRVVVVAPDGEVLESWDVGRETDLTRGGVIEVWWAGIPSEHEIEDVLEKAHHARAVKP